MRRSVLRRVRSRVGCVIAGGLLVALLPSQALAVPPPDDNRNGVDLIDLQTEDEAVDADTGDLGVLTGEGTVEPTEYEPANTEEPAGGSGAAALNSPTAGTLVQAGELPVLVGVPEGASSAGASALAGSWTVEMATPTQTEASDIDGALLTVTPPATATGKVDIALDYSDFEQLYSADWADRLEFVQLPECFLTTPDVEGCDEVTHLSTDNDDDTGRITVTVDVDALATTASSTSTSTAVATTDGVVTDGVYREDTAQSGALKSLLPAASTASGSAVLAATDKGSGAKGDFTATPLASAGTWSAGGSSGAFTYSYKVTSPPVSAGPTPAVTFSYNSQIVDGRTSVTNNQASWIGDGWDYNPGSIERTYRTCSDDTDGNANNASHKTGDLCWGSDNAVLNLGGSTTELVKDDESDEWVTANGDGTKIEQLFDTSLGNSDDRGEHWLVTTRDGTQYHFGLNKLPGWTSGDETTDSVLTVPVASNHPLEPCYDADFADSFCDQGWRWNLDYVVDTKGNAMTLWWGRESNYYAENEDYDSPTKYYRGGFLDRIEYGQRKGTLFSAEPVAMVDFVTAQRCFAEDGLNCTDDAFASGDSGQYRIWYDTPADLHCSGETGDNCYVGSPTFFSRKLLSSLTTYAQRKSGDTTLYKVDSYDLTQSFPKTLTDGAPPLWLESISRKGFGADEAGDPDGDAEEMAAVEFSHNNSPMPNRVVEGGSDPGPAFDRLRIRRVISEYGGETDIEYSTPEGACASGSGFPAKESNGGLCYPVYWSPGSSETIDWFNKYVVTSVTQKPRVDGEPDVVTTYDYKDDAAWAKNQTEFSKKKTRTYDQWRGYAQVNTLNTATDASYGIVRSETAVRYFRGMNGDPLPSDATRSVLVKDSTGATIATDKPAFQGRTAESITYTSAGGSVASRTVTYPSAHLLATRARDDVPDLEAYRIQTDNTITVTPSSGTGDDTRTSRTVKVTTTYDDYGLPTQVQSQGDTGATGDETCTVTSYLHDKSAHLIGLVKQVKTTAGLCSAADTATGDDVVAGTRTAYDGGEYGDAPTTGQATKVWTVDGDGDGWTRTSTTTYDDYGRVETVTDAAEETAYTTYTPSTGQTYSTTVKNALGYTSTTTTDPARGTALKSTDANGNSTVYEYDALGRATKMWTASQDASTDNPSTTYSYHVVAGKPTAVTTSVLRDTGSYEDTIVLYDGLGRERQTQSEAVGGGRLVTDTHYNANGTVWRTDNSYLAEGEPDSELFEPKSDFQFRSSTVTTYDGQGRALTVTPYESGTAKISKRTWYTYGSDYAKTLQPAGSTSTRMFADALGRTVRIDRYTDASRTSYTSTRYKYDTRGNRVSAEDTAGNTWTWTYDARGRQVEAVDPDTGTTTTTYNDLDQPVTTTTAKGTADETTVWTGYDELGRTTEQRLNDDSGTQLTSFAYDTLAGGLGQQTSSTRYTDGKAYTTAVTGYDEEYRPTGKSVTIPDTTATKGLAGTYTYGFTYTATGKVASTTVPAAGGLAKEEVVSRYNGDGLPASTSGTAWYTADVDYSPYGEVLRAVTGEQPYRVWTTNIFNAATGQLDRTVADRETADSHRVNDRYYAYDASGNIIQLTDFADGTTDRQCFTYDVLGQLTEAWTSPKSGCGATEFSTRQPVYADGTVNVTSANDGYWQTYSYDTIGNRSTLVEHDPDVTLTDGAVDTSGDATTSYDYGIDPSGSGVLKQPHTLTSITSDTESVDTQASLGYDSSGNTTTRMYGGDTQSLTWTWDGKIESVSGFGVEGDGQAVGLSGKCLDLSSSSTTAGTAIQLYSCNGTKAQRFRIDPADDSDASTGALKVLKQCVMPKDGGTANGTAVVIAACSGATNQQWTSTDSNTLKHVASGKCLDVPSSNSASGTDLQLYTCNASSAQTWAFDDKTNYIYDASGNRLVASTASAHTLYLDGMELSTDANGATSYCQRYYAQAGAPTVMRSSTRGSSTSTLIAMVADHQGTTIATINLSSGQTVKRQKTDAFGVERTSNDTWTSHRGYIGGTDDNTTGLTHLGAREYDPETGRFISADPVLDIADPMSMNGYAYSNNSPVSHSDPSGLKPVPDGGGGGTSTVGCPSLINPVCPEYTEGGGSDDGTSSSSDSQIVTRTVTQTVTVTKPPADCNWKCKLGNWWESNKVELVSFVVDVAVSGVCYGVAAGAGTVTGGVGYGIAAGCGALGGMAGGLTRNLMDENADHSTDGILKSELEGAAFGAVGGAGGHGLLQGMQKGANAIAGKLLSGCSKLGNSFVPGTLVLMADGTTKAIEDVKLGDKVMATDPETGETRAEEVTATILGKGVKHLVKVTVDVDGEKGDKTATVTATDGHPFWVAELGEWIDATDLASGEWLRTGAGTSVQIAAVERWTTLYATVHNLTVAGEHTYYVLAGATPVLVHNCGGAVPSHPTTCDCANGGVPKVRNGKLAGDAHPRTSVPFDSNGFPDFSAWRHPQVSDVRIQLTGSRSKDFRLANKAAGLSSTPPGYTWHHHQDPGLMQLIERQIHANTGHTGGF
ncbi:ricin-type beta-trefoil lectin domain protein [Streptomyces fulvoviolaceus]|uniref:ricin-type beta-trefoil lectin domain protein n=1 Tax=Streptomyces fulvoviolaceus TaxID=285535 RepID=UPI0021C1FA73|nr:ricin-type beta-trefoil lectin domain protein [Streptomyces fulvoviolaceus]MCT9078513.1 ricin-type beta-trefoil lectin domain protein [Streptomyces fulvoviolaceus]